MPITGLDVDNASRDMQDLGKILNNPAGSPPITTREGLSVKSIPSVVADLNSLTAGPQAAAAGLAAARAEAAEAATRALAVGVYDTVAAGLAATTNGAKFAVIGTGFVSESYYRNNAGAAALIGQKPSSAGIRYRDAWAAKDAMAAAGGSADFLFAAKEQLFQDAAGTIPVTAPGDPVRLVVPIGGAPDSPLALVAVSGIAATYGVDARGVPYVDTGATAVLQTGATLHIKPDTLLGMATSRVGTADTVCLRFADGAGTGANNIYAEFPSGGGFFAADSGIAPVNYLYPRGYITDGTPFTFDYLLKAGTSSSWINGSGRSMPAPSNGLPTGSLRTVPNGWAVGNDFGTSRLVVGSNTRFHALAFYQGVTTRFQRREMNDWLKRQAGIALFDQQAYDKFVVIGDSNMTGTSGSTATGNTVSPAYGTCGEFLDIGYVKPLYDPTQHLHPDQWAANGSAWPAFGVQWFARTGSPALICGAADGTGVGLWAGHHGGYLGADNYLLDKVADKARRMQAVPGTLRGVICSLGGNDVVQGTVGTYDHYKAGFVELRDRLRKALGDAGLQLLLAQCDSMSNTAYDAGFATVHQATIDAAAENEGITLISVFQNYLAQGRHVAPPTNDHIDQIGLNDWGTRMADGAANALIYTD